jgi:hypothetical protein
MVSSFNGGEEKQGDEFFYEAIPLSQSFPRLPIVHTCGAEMWSAPPPNA